MWDVNKDLETEAIVNEWICYQQVHWKVLIKSKSSSGSSSG